ncbi:MAG: NAD(P)-dependent oxidoreductase [Chloroflexota bacterium]|nr:MAG: NAD(P)-dependent oxidoreductase [Chloroflexota bacterium]
MSILITGGTGFIGSYLARKLIDEGEDRLTLFDLTPNLDNVQDIAAHVDVVQGDFSDPLELMTVLKNHDITVIFHLAYLIFQDQKHPSQAVRTNIVGTTNLFEMARVSGVRRVIWASSAAVNGIVSSSEKASFLTEDDKPAINSLYGASKLFNEHYAEDLVRKYGFDHIALRISSTYGLGRAQRAGFASWGIYPGTGDVHSYLIERTVRGEASTAPPENHLLPWSYVKDCALAFYCAYKADRPEHRIFNFMCEVRPVKDTVDYLKTLFPNAAIEIGTEAATMVPYLDTQRIRDELGFKPEYSMEQGIKDYVDILLSKRPERV